MSDASARDDRLVAIGVGVAFGVLLGCWCRAFASSTSFIGVLANLASPWVAAAFASGAVVAGRSKDAMRRGTSPISAAIVGAVAGTLCLVVATVVYYGPARTGGLDFDGAVFRTVFWTAAGIAAGAVFGGAGALWRAASSPRVRSVAVSVFGSVVVGEALFLVATGATSYDAFALPVLLVVGAVGLTLPLVLGPNRAAPHAVLWVALLSVPVLIGGTVLLSAATVAARVLRGAF